MPVEHKQHILAYTAQPPFPDIAIYLYTPFNQPCGCKPGIPPPRCLVLRLRTPHRKSYTNASAAASFIPMFPHHLTKGHHAVANQFISNLSSLVFSRRLHPSSTLWCPPGTVHWTHAHSHTSWMTTGHWEGIVDHSRTTKEPRSSEVPWGA